MIRVLEKALDLLEYMSCDGSRDYTLTELATVTGDAVSTTSNILKTLCARGYMAKGEGRGRYRLGRMARGITPYAGLEQRLRQAAESPMGELVKRTSASGVLSALLAREKHVIARYRSDSVLEVNMELVTSSSLFSTSTGLVLLAGMEDRGESVPDAHARAEKALGSWEAFQRMLEAIRESGYYYGSLKQGITEAAISIRLQDRAVAAIGIYFPKIYEEAMNREQTIAALMETAAVIEKNLEVFV